jgi:hypothetical protein
MKMTLPLATKIFHQIIMIDFQHITAEYHVPIFTLRSMKHNPLIQVNLLIRRREYIKIIAETFFEFPNLLLRGMEHMC